MSGVSDEEAFARAAGLVRGAGDVERFRDQPVDRALVDAILEGASAWWPPRFTQPPWRVMVVVGEERERLVGRVAEALARHWGLGPLGPRGLASEAVLNAPVLVVVFSTVPASEGVEAFGLVAGLAQNIVLLARAVGLGSHRIFSAHVVPEAALDYAAEFLGPEIRGGELVTLLAIGWPDGPPAAAPGPVAPATWVGGPSGSRAPEDFTTPPGDLKPPAQVLRSPRRERVLVVDPYPYNRALLEAQLVRAGYAVEVFSDGRSLISEVRARGEADLYVVSDTLPDTTGFELVREMNGAGAHAPVIVTTSRRDSAFRIAGLSAGVDYYLRKPVNAVELFTAARILLDRRRLIRELERVTAFQQALLAAMDSVGVVALDDKLNVIYVSPGITRLTGYGEDDLVGRPPWVGVKAWEDQPRGSPAELPRTDLTVRRKDGGVFDAELLRTAMRDPAGRVTGYVAVLVDIDDRKRMERQLRSANTELERLLDELRATQARLVQHAKMAALGQLVAGVAHEINTPLAAVVSNNDLFLRCFARLRAALARTDVSGEPLIARDLSAIEELSVVTRSACARITGIVRTLRTFARLDEAEVQAVDLHEGLESTLVLIAHLLKGGIRLERRYGELPRVECHSNQVNQVFMNLLVNACQAMGDKGTITLTTRAMNRGEEVEVTIADTGAGIPRDRLERIFDPGFTTKGAPLGTGLGLSIVFQIVEGHGGEIRVESEVGRGTAFTLRLPVRHVRPRSNESGDTDEPPGELSATR
ncbi:MAG TPA: ATP-binding protein [Polyangia bacterium]